MSETVQLRSSSRNLSLPNYIITFFMKIYETSSAATAMILRMISIAR